jgi:hypothetical protein
MSHQRMKALADKASLSDRVGAEPLRPNQNSALLSPKTGPDKDSRKQTARMIAYHLRRATTIRLDP